jgi:hypothetical protein
MEHVFSKEFELRYFEMNKYGMASPTTILTLLRRDRGGALPRYRAQPLLP